MHFLPCLHFPVPVGLTYWPAPSCTVESRWEAWTLLLRWRPQLTHPCCQWLGEPGALRGDIRLPLPWCAGTWGRPGRVVIKGPVCPSLFSPPLFMLSFSTLQIPLHARSWRKICGMAGSGLSTRVSHCCPDPGTQGSVPLAPSFPYMLHQSSNINSRWLWGCPSGRSKKARLKIHGVNFLSTPLTLKVYSHRTLFSSFIRESKKYTI